MSRGGITPADWHIITDTSAGSQIWTPVGSGTIFAFTGAATWGNYRFTLQVKRMTGDANLYFRRKAPEGYALRLESKGIVLWTEQGGMPQDLTSVSFAAGTDWYNYSIEAVGNVITIAVDGTVVLTSKDTGSGSLAGIIAVEATGSDGARFDNIRVTGLEDVPDAWIQTNGPVGGMMCTLEIHPTDPDTIFAGGMGGVFKSVNGGGVWTPLPAFSAADGEVSKLLINPDEPLKMYALFSASPTLGSMN